MIKISNFWIYCSLRAENISTNIEPNVGQESNAKEGEVVSLEISLPVINTENEEFICDHQNCGLKFQNGLKLSFEAISS